MEALFTQLNLQTLINTGLILILVLVFEINLFKAFKRWIQYKYDELNLKQYDIDTHLNVTDDIEARLDTVIESCFQEYSLMNLIYKTDWYIKEDEEVQICKDICGLVNDRISPVVMKQLALYYKEDAIINIIAKRVYFKVTNFVIEHNKNKP